MLLTLKTLNMNVPPRHSSRLSRCSSSPLGNVETRRPPRRAERNSAITNFFPALHNQVFSEEAPCVSRLARFLQVFWQRPAHGRAKLNSNFSIERMKYWHNSNIEAFVHFSVNRCGARRNPRQFASEMGIRGKKRPQSSGMVK